MPDFFNTKALASQRGALDESKKKITELEGALTLARRDASDKQKTLDEFQAEFIQLRSKLVLLTTEIDAERTRRLATERREEEARRVISEFSIEITKLTADRNRVTSMLELEQDRAKKELTTNQRIHGELRELIAEERRKLAAAEGETSTARTEAIRARKERDEIERGMKRAVSQGSEQLAREVEAHRQSVSLLRNQIAGFEAKQVEGKK